MRQKTDATRILWILFSVYMLAVCFAFTNCGKHHDHPFAPEDHDHSHEHPHEHDTKPDTVFIEVPVNVTCDTVDLEIEYTLIGDQSVPNIYAEYRNNVEVLPHIVISETYPAPTELLFRRQHDGFILGQETITIRKIEGSRAETIGSAIVGIECSD